MITKTHRYCIKSLTEDGIFEGYASVFNIVDHQKDIIVPGAFQASLPQGEIKMLWQHDMEHPIGVWEELSEDAYGLYVKGRLLMDLAKAKEAYTLLKAGVVDGLSIGFVPKKQKTNKETLTRYIYDLDLIEISLVTFAANPKAKVLSVKNQCFSRTIQSIQQKIKDFQDHLLFKNFAY